MEQVSTLRVPSHRSWHLTAIFAVLGLVAMLLSPVIARADTVINSVVNNGGTSVTIAEGEAVEVSYWIQVQGGGVDGQGGCNAADATPATVTINVPTGVTATPSTLTFTQCGDGRAQTVLFSADEGGDYVIGDVTVSDGGTGSYAKDDTDFTLIVEVPADTTPPVLTLPSSATVEATGPSGATVTYTASALDDIDGAITPGCEPASGSTFGFGSTKVTCTATDAAGNETTGSFTITVGDTTGPVLTLPSSSTVEATGPLGATLTYTASASDLVDGSRPVSCDFQSGATFPIGETTVQCSAADSRGNSTSGSFTITVEDTTAPELTLPSNTTVEATGPSGAAVTYTASASDLVDGSVGVNCTPASGSTFGFGPTTVDCSAVDAAGNEATDSFTITVEDTTAPTNIAFVGNIAQGGNYVFGSVPSVPTCTAEDAVTVSPTCVVSGYSTAVGAHTLTATATDAAGNSAKATRSYTVLAWTLNGFYQPVDMSGTLNTVKAGSTVPLKFEVFAGSTELTALSTVSSFKTALVPCGALSAVVDEIEVTTTGGTVLRYDSTGGQFIQNWQTPKGGAGTCHRVTMTTQDGSTLVAYFKLR